jgi:Sulfotransferase domain
MARTSEPFPARGSSPCLPSPASHPHLASPVTERERDRQERVRGKQYQARQLPNCIAVGVGRSGTTWLHEVLTGHVGLPYGVKETDFFWRKYGNGIDWYQSFFRHCIGGLPILEICPTYFSSAEARQRMKLHIPDCRIISTFREPVERAYSHYKLMRHNVWTRASFEEVVSRSREIAEMNQYALNLRGWQQTFGRDNVLVCLYDDLEQDPQGYLDAVCNFIGIPPFALERSVASVRLNSFPTAPRNRRLAQNARHVRDWLRGRRAYWLDRLFEHLGIWAFCFDGGEAFPPLEPELEKRLKQKFLPEVEALEQLIGRDLSAWKLSRDGSSPAHPQPAAGGPL